MTTRRSLFAIAAAAALAASSPAFAAEPATGDMTLGAPSAKLTVIEYGSITCTHCAAFRKEVFDAFKAKYVDTGKVRFVFREFPTAPQEVSVAGFMLARCAGPSRYFQSLDAMFAAQDEMFRTQSAAKFLEAGAKAGGLDDAAADACLKNDAVFDGLKDRVEHAVEVDKVDGTPTFLIGDKKIVGVPSLAELDAAIQPQLAK